MQPQAKYKLLLHRVYLAIYLLRVILIKTHNSLGEIAERAPENYRELSEVSQVSESHLSITGQGPSYCLTTHPRITARPFLIPTLSLPLGAPLSLGAGGMALRMPGPALQQHTHRVLEYFCDSCTSHIPDDRWTPTYFSSHAY